MKLNKCFNAFLIITYTLQLKCTKPISSMTMWIYTSCNLSNIGFFSLSTHLAYGLEHGLELAEIRRSSVDVCCISWWKKAWENQTKKMHNAALHVCLNKTRSEKLNTFIGLSEILWRNWSCNIWLQNPG